MLWWILAAAAALIVVALSIPVKIRVKSNLVCLIQWLFLKLAVSYRDKGLVVELIFYKKRRLLNGKNSSPRAPVTSSPPPRRRKNIYSYLAKALSKDAEVRKLAYKILRLFLGLAKAFRFVSFKCDIGLKDYYRQGILTGLLHALPSGDNFRISGNFTGVSRFSLMLRLSLWKAFFALAGLAFRFPYLKVFRFYRKALKSEITPRKS